MKRIWMFLSIFLIAQTVRAQGKLDTVTVTTQSPYNKICFLRITRGGEAEFKSTGFFIAPNVILTAAHNLHPGKSRVSKIEIVPARNYENYPYGILRISGVDSCSKYIRTGKGFSFLNLKKWRVKDDFGIIILPVYSFKDSKDLDKIQPFVIDSNYVLKVNDKLNVAGYPADPDYHFNGDFMTFQTGVCSEIGDRKFFHKLDTYRGNSGSPIWVESGGEQIVVGIHTYGGMATYLNKKNVAEITSWIR